MIVINYKMNYQEILDIIYQFYPKGINFYNEDNSINEKYIDTKENKNLVNNLSMIEKIDFGDYLVSELNTIYNIKLRNISNFHMGDRAHNIQYSGFFFKEKLKYYPVCFVFSTLCPVYYYYIIDVDVSFDNLTLPSSYTWKRNNGKIDENREDFTQLIIKIEDYLTTHTNYSKISTNIAEKIIPDLCNEAVNKGRFTVFNALFLDDYYCFP
ncbi:hypothetical protein ACXIHB_10025 [Tenacibaculum sp. IMCC1]|uniref:Uncharacterized protein n=1 Tax=Tenacibaculum sp. Pbs-1 TaxID=3238748 RepID=A0AB33L1L5_9FLAO